MHFGQTTAAVCSYRKFGTMKPNFTHFFLLLLFQKEYFGATEAQGQCNSPLGIEDKTIPDSDLTASSSWPGEYDHGARVGRLNTLRSDNVGEKRAGAWCAEFKIAGEWMQINLRRITKVTAIATQGRQDSDQWVTSYTICYGQKLDGFCQPLNQIFQGNTDRNTIVVRTFTTPIYARFIRVLVLSWVNHNSMRLELYGCREGFTPFVGPVCMDSLGMETGKIPDSDITASSTNTDFAMPEFARLNKQIKNGGWAAKTLDQHQWIQVKFAQRVTIRGVATQGRRSWEQWVTSYTLNYSTDGLNFQQYKTNRQETVLFGNTDRNTVVTNVLNPPIIAQYIRVLPVTWHGHMAMRMDFYGCIPDPSNPKALYPLNSKFGTKDLSSNQNAAGIPSNVQLAPGPNGEANGSYQFSGSLSSYIEFPNAGGLDTRKSLTLLAWVFPENSDGPIFNYGTNYFGVHLWVATDKLFARFVSRLGVFAVVLISNTWSLNKWHFVGTSYDYDSGIHRLWLDGKVYDRQNIGTFEIDTQAAVRMGAMIGDNRVLKGRISCMQVYNKALTENEVHAARGICSERVPLRPLAFFPLNGQFETADISLSFNPPGISNDVQLAPGPDGSTGGSYQFSGNLTSFIRFPNNGGLDTRYSMTFLAWIYHDQAGKGPIFYYAQQESGGYGVRIILNEKDRFNIQMRYTNSTAMVSSSSDILTPKAWHFVGGTYDYTSGNFKIWVNGTVNSDKLASWPSESLTQQSVIMGAITGFNGNFKGRISCVQLYDRVLTGLEIEKAKQSCFTTGRSNSNQTVHLGEAVELKCDALEGKTVQWSKDGAVLQKKTAGYGTSLLISSVQQADEGVYTCDVMNSAGTIQASYDVTLRVEDPNFLCSTFNVDDYKSESQWKRWSVFPSDYNQSFNEEKWFKADRGSAMLTSCVLPERCHAQAPGWLSGISPSREDGIVHGQACFNFRKDCCYYSLSVQIKKCSDFFVYKLQEAHPIIPGQYCFTADTLDFVDSIHNVMYTATNVTRLPNATIVASEKSVESSQQCMRLCKNFGDGQQCLSFNYNSITQECQLHNETGRRGNGYKDMRRQVSHDHHYDKFEDDPIRLP